MSTESIEGSCDSWRVFDKLDTTKYSVVHRLYDPLISKYNNCFISYTLISLIVIGVTFLPLLVSGYIELPTFTKEIGNLKLPFFWDFNMLFMLLISFPMLLYFAVSDQPILINAIKNVTRENILSISIENAQNLVKKWENRFKKFNIISRLCGIMFGGLAVYVNYIMWSSPNVGFWAYNGTRFYATGLVYLYCVFSFYYIISVYIIRIGSITLFLQDMVKYAEVTLNPLHLDRCGGLSPVGKIGLRHQYPLAVIGVNLVIFYFWDLHYLGRPAIINIVLIILVVAYFIVGPLIFFLPLIPFHEPMINFKSKLVNEFSLILQGKLDRIRTDISDKAIIKEGGDIIIMLKEIIIPFKNLPVWPFDTETLSKFFMSYLPPAVSLIFTIFKDRIIALLHL
jgi:hypothetical protein